MPEVLISAGPSNELESGLFPAVDQSSAPFWFDGENVEFRGGGIQSSKGFIPMANIPGVANELAQAYNAGEQRAYFAVGNGVYLMSSKSGLSLIGTLPDVGIPCFETFGSFLLVTNYSDPPMYWKNTGSLIPWPNLPFTWAKLLHRRDNHVLALNTSNGQNAYEWCSASAIDDWTPTSSNSAGNNWIRDLDSEIVAAVDIGRQTAVYSKETMGLIQFVGQPNVFAHTQAINGVGAVGAKSVIQVGAQNYGLNRQGVFVTDGSSFEYVDEPAFHEFLINDVDFTKGEEVKGYHNEDLGSVIWFYTRKDNTRYGFGFNYKRKTFTKYNQNVAIAIERQVFATPIAAVGNQLVFLNVGHNAAGSPLPKWIRTKPLSAQDATIFKAWSHIKAVGDWAGTQVRVGVLDNPNSSDIEWIDTQDLQYENWIDRDSVFLLLEFRADILDSHFGISQLQVQGIPTGRVSG